MADIYLDVPFVSQLNIGGHAGVGRDETNGCWYATCCMIGYYHEQGPRLGVPSRYVKPDGSPQDVDKKGNTAPLPVSPTVLEDVARNEGLVQVPLPTDKKWTCDGLATVLRECGPCFVGRGFVQNGTLVGGHIICLVGARSSDNVVTVHDPWTGPNKTMSIAEFNSIFPWNRPEAPWLMMTRAPKVQTRARSNAISAPIGGQGAPASGRPRSNAISQ
jgi:hypothetical protein